MGTGSIKAILAAAAGTGGATPTADGKDFGDRITDAADLVPKLAVAIGALLLVGLGAVVLFAFLKTTWRRMTRASLVVRIFQDGAVESKVGAGVAGLIEERLIGALRRRAHAPDGFDLDLVVTDVELLAEENDLAKAVERLAGVPQFQVMVGILHIVERLLPSRGLSTAGELLPPGSEGAGVALALYEGNS